MDAYAHTSGELLPTSWRYPLEPMILSLISRQRVRLFAELMLKGVCFPAIQVVVGNDGRFAAIDGTHRLAASLLAGFRWVPVIVNPTSTTSKS
jgi:hypothetical protein